MSWLLPSLNEAGTAMRHTILDSVAHTFTGHLKDLVPLSTPFDHVVRAMLQSARGLFERSAANVFVHQFHTLG